MRDFSLIPDLAGSGASEGLDGEDVALLHLGGVVGLDDGHALGAVDAVGQDGVAAQVADRLDGVRGAVDLALVALHGLLDVAAELAQADVDAGLLDARVGGVLYGGQQVVVHGVEGNGEGAVDDLAVDVDANVDLHDVALLQDRLVAGVGAIVRGDVVEVQAGREAHAGDDGVALGEAIVADEAADAVLDAVGDLGQGLAGLDVLLRPLADLSVGLGGVAVVGEELGVQVVEVALLLVGGPEPVLVDVLDLLALGVGVVGEELGEEDAGRVGLRGGSLLLLLGLSLLLLFLGGSLSVGSGGAVLGIVVGLGVRVLSEVTVGRDLCVGLAIDGAVSFGHCGRSVLVGLPSKTVDEWAVIRKRLTTELLELLCGNFSGHLGRDSSVSALELSVKIVATMSAYHPRQTFFMAPVGVKCTMYSVGRR